jgi:hypothetical protein
MLWEPHLEGRNANATLFEIYFTDPFLAYVYAASIPFFVALSRAFKLLGYIRRQRAFSYEALGALRTITYCAFITAGTIVAADVYLAIRARLPGSTDDPAGAVMLGIIAGTISIVVGIAAALAGRLLKNAMDIKAENDLVI